MQFLQKYKDQIGLLLIWLLLIIIINPTGDFPLNDDWCYGKSVKTLVEEGYLKLYNWGEMTLIAHVYFGSIFAEFFGFSFTALRWSTLVIGATAILGIYQLCLLVGASRKVALLSALVSIVNPLFLGLSFSFMTDVPFYAIAIWSFYFFVKALQTDTWKPLVIAILLCCWALLIRQIALVFPVAWLIAIIFTKKLTKQNILKAILPLVILLTLYFGYTIIMKQLGMLQGRYNDKLHRLFEAIQQLSLKKLNGIFIYFLVCLSYIGFLLSPIHLIRLVKDKVSAYIIIAFTLLGTAYLIYAGKTIPTLDNVWIDFGIGPTTMYDHYGFFKLAPDIQAPSMLRWFMTGLGLLSSVALLFSLKDTVLPIVKRKKGNAILVFSLLCMAIYLAPFLLLSVYDRYLLFVIPMVIAVLVYNYKGTITRQMQVISLLFIMALGIFSVSATHDYLSWNRVRWELLNELEASGVPVNHIQGGAEHTTWNQFSETQEAWWNNVIPVYAVVFKPTENVSVLKHKTYSRWLPGNNDIYLVFDEAKAKEVE